MQSETNAVDAAPVENRRINYVLIDHENVQPHDLALLDREDVRLWVFIGAGQAKLSSALAIQMHAMRERAEYVRISGNGANALDFHIALYIGRLMRDDPRGFFHIISKDTGFDPLVTHLKSKQVLACRSASIGEMPLFKRAVAAIPKSSADAGAKVVGGQAQSPAVKVVKPAPAPVPAAAAKSGKKAMNHAERVQAVRTTLDKMGKARPTKLASLENHVSAQFQKQVNAAEVAALIAALQKAGALKVDNGKVAYC